MGAIAMAKVNVTIKMDENDKITFEELCSKLGLSMNDAFNIFIQQCLGMNALKKAGRISKENGNSEMTLDEINEEIRLAREAMDNRKKENK